MRVWKRKLSGVTDNAPIGVLVLLALCFSVWYQHTQPGTLKRGRRNNITDGREAGLLNVSQFAVQYHMDMKANTFP